MDKFLRRKPTDDAGPDDAKKQARVRPTFVVAPGASGGDCALLSAALGTLGRTCTIAGGKWAGNFPSQMGANVALVEAAASRAAADAPDAPVVLVGHSFGCRVVAALLVKHAAARDLPANVVLDGAVLESYPLYGDSPPKPTTDRAAAARALPAEAKVLFLSGANDPFLNRTNKWRDATAPIGAAALDAVLADAPCRANCTVVAIDGAGHNALKASKAKQETARRTAIAALKAHVRVLCPEKPAEK